MKSRIVLTVILLATISTIGTPQEKPPTTGTEKPVIDFVPDEPQPKKTSDDPLRALAEKTAREVEEEVARKRQERLEKKKDELKKKGIDIELESATPKVIEELLEKNVLTVDDVENIFPEETLMGVSALTVFRQMEFEDAEVSVDGVQVWVFLIGEGLFRLRYYAELPSGELTPGFKEAVKDFQRSLGHEPTGELLLGEMTEIMKRLDTLDPERIMLPPGHVYAMGGYASLQGTWVFAYGTPQAFPIQTSVIELDKSTMSGVEAMASVAYMSSPILQADLVRWRITKWDPQEIIAQNDAPLNASYTLTVDLTQKKAYMFRRHKGEKIFGEVELEPSILELVDGFQVSSDFHKKRQAEAREAYNLKYRAIYEKLLPADPKK
jgi:hypothetical protein